MNMMSKIELTASTSNLIALPLITEGVSAPFADLLRRFIAYRAEYEAAPTPESGDYPDFDPDGLRDAIADHPAESVADVAAKAALAMFELRGTTRDSVVTADRVTFDSEAEHHEAAEALMLAAARDAARLSATQGDWETALSDYRAKRAISDQTGDDDAAVDDAVDAYCDAMDHLITNTPAPDISAMCTKVELALERSAAFEGMFADHKDAIISDLRRLAKRTQDNGGYEAGARSGRQIALFHVARAWIDRWRACGGDFGKVWNADGSFRSLTRGVPMADLWRPTDEGSAKLPPHTWLLEEAHQPGAVKTLEGLLELVPGLKDAIFEIVAAQQMADEVPPA